MRRLKAGIALLLMLLIVSACDAPRNEDTMPETVTPLQTAEPTPEPSAEPTPMPTPEPTPTPEELAAEFAAKAAAEMELRELACGMFMVYPEQLTGGTPVLSGNGALLEGFAKYPVAGVILSYDHLETPEQTRGLTASLQAFGGGIFIAVDEEGGMVNRVMEELGTRWVDSPFTYRDGGTDAAYANARVIGEDLASLGFNLDFAPVADVWSNPENTVIGERAYSDDFAEAAELVSAAVRGFHDGGVLCTLKHFPGHGDTAQDSHVGMAVTYKTLEEMRGQEFLPFAAGISAGADFVMLAHVTAPEIAELPGSLSYTVAAELLRGELGFEGIIITDAMEMGAIVNTWGAGESTVMAIEAGADIILCPEDLDAAVEAVLTAVEEGRIPRERLEESARRVLYLKAMEGILPGR